MKSRFSSQIFAVAAVLFTFAAPLGAEVPLETFRNFETPHVSPLALSPDGSHLAACNTPDHRIEIFSTSATTEPGWSHSIQVGFEPVSARFRNDRELWVVNQLSDSISVVDLEANAVVRTIETLDEPADIVFAGNPLRAFVTCSAVDTVLVYDLADLTAAPLRVPIEG
ncbi:MAG: YVTN family beta-propeller protein [Verrucomicrobiales bacterium]